MLFSFAPFAKKIPHSTKLLMLMSGAGVEQTFHVLDTRIGLSLAATSSSMAAQDDS
jgi:hypothetical protein